MSIARLHIHGHRFELELQDAADPMMRVMRLRARYNFLAGFQLPRHPERFEIGHRAAAAQMPQEILPAEHRREFPPLLLSPSRKSRAHRRAP